jgi:hypothetical protein
MRHAALPFYPQLATQQTAAAMPVSSAFTPTSMMGEASPMAMDTLNVPCTTQVILIDTNIFIARPEVVDCLLACIAAAAQVEGTSTYAYIPFVVLQELDGLKERHFQARQSIRTLFKYWKVRHPRILGQSLLDHRPVVSFGTSFLCF